MVVSGHGLPKSSGDSTRTWFVTECTTAVHGRMNPATDTPHCDISHARALRVSANGTFSSRFRLTAGHHRRRLVRDGRARHLCDRRRDRPGTGHRRAGHLQDTAACAGFHQHDQHDRLTKAPNPTDQVSCSHSRWL